MDYNSRETRSQLINNGGREADEGRNSEGTLVGEPGVAQQDLQVRYRTHGLIRVHCHQKISQPTELKFARTIRALRHGEVLPLHCTFSDKFQPSQAILSPNSVFSFARVAFT
jgi:hypothetical protein